MDFDEFHRSVFENRFIKYFFSHSFIDHTTPHHTTPQNMCQKKEKRKNNSNGIRPSALCVKSNGKRKKNPFKCLHSFANFFFFVLLCSCKSRMFIRGQQTQYYTKRQDMCVKLDFAVRLKGRNEFLTEINRFT